MTPTQMCGIVNSMNKELTKKQERVLEFIREKVRRNIPPTIREIARELGFSSTGTVRDYLNALQSKGYLKRSSNKSRGIELLKTLSPFRLFLLLPQAGLTWLMKTLKGILTRMTYF